MATMTEAQEIILALTSDFSTPVPVPCLRGIPGVGKTDLCKRIAGLRRTDTDQNYQMVHRFMGSETVEDLVGMPIVDGKTKRTTWCMPDWWPDAQKFPNGLMVLDEADRAPKEVMDSFLLQVLRNRAWRGNRLPNGTKGRPGTGWAILLAMNGDAEGCETNMIDLALEGRIQLIDLQPTADEFCEWGESNGVRDDVREFLRKHPELLARYEQGLAKANPRAWEYASALMDRLDGHASLPELLSNQIGSLVATQFLAFLEERKIPNIKRIASGSAKKAADLNAAQKSRFVELVREWAMDNPTDAQARQNVIVYAAQYETEFAAAVHAALTR